jgi:hypothetical protein
MGMIVTSSFTELIVTIVYQVQGKADLNTLPNSVHFSDSQKLKVPKRSITPEATTTSTIANSASNPMLPLLGQPNPLMIMQLLQQMAHPVLTPAFPNPYNPYFSPIALLAASATVTDTSTLEPPMSAPLELPRTITLDEFCQRYEITPEDHTKLVTLDVIPGDL